MLTLATLLGKPALELELLVAGTGGGARPRGPVGAQHRVARPVALRARRRDRADQRPVAAARPPRRTSSGTYGGPAAPASSSASARRHRTRPKGWSTRAAGAGCRCWRSRSRCRSPRSPRRRRRSVRIGAGTRWSAWCGAETRWPRRSRTALAPPACWPCCGATMTLPLAVVDRMARPLASAGAELSAEQRRRRRRRWPGIRRRSRSIWPGAAARRCSWSGRSGTSMPRCVCLRPVSRARDVRSRTRSTRRRGSSAWRSPNSRRSRRSSRGSPASCST